VPSCKPPVLRPPSSSFQTMRRGVLLLSILAGGVAGDVVKSRIVTQAARARSSAVPAAKAATPDIGPAHGAAAAGECSTLPSIQVHAPPPHSTPVHHPDTPYWYHPKIHNLGNIGLGGRLHSLMAPFATFLIDMLAYGGKDARKLVHKTISPEHSVVDLCCGVGFSTFPGATAVDTSVEMLDMARLRRPDARFVEGNAETWGEDGCADVVTIMYGMHEIPQEGRKRVLANAARIARKHVIIVDIDPSYCPSETMLSGEPYVRDYLRHIDADVGDVARTRAFRSMRVNVVPGHVVMWRLDL